MPSAPPRIVVAPLNWGLGHATRCIPLIKQLRGLGCEVIIAAHGAASFLLKREFPSLEHIATPGKTVHYGKSRIGFFFSMLWQIPSFWRQLKEEKKWIYEFVNRYQPQLIISDNRYGIYHKDVPSILITHQLGIKTGLGKIADGALQQFLYHWLKKFNEVWVPDHRGQASLAGSLSHPDRMPNTPVFYIGTLNKFEEFKTSNKEKKDSVENPSLLAILSGPEPQRSLLENILKEQLTDYPGKATILQGLPQVASTPDLTPETKQQLPLLYGAQNMEIIPHLPPEELFQKILEADIILCRSGYTSLMELLPLQKKLILIPTPGQAEQEYLAAYCNEKGWATYETQKRLILQKLIHKVNSRPFKISAMIIPEANHQIQERVHYYLRSL